MTDQQAHAALAAYRDATCPGSYLAISHISRIVWTADQMAALLAVSEQTPTPERERTPEELRALLTGYTLEPPGLVPAPRWHPDQPPEDDLVARSNCYAALGYRR